jgi:hypothetical protein
MNESEYTTQELLEICAIDNGWAAEELARRIEVMRSMLFRFSTLCNHLSVERDGKIRRAILGRWLIADEPLRSDARHLLTELGKVLRDK